VVREHLNTPAKVGNIDLKKNLITLRQAQLFTLTLENVFGEPVAPVLAGLGKPAQFLLGWF